MPLCMSLLPPLSDYMNSFRCDPFPRFVIRVVSATCKPPRPLLIYFSSSVVPVLLHPLSRGRILLKSKLLNDHPIIEPNYLTQSLDVATLADACLTAMRRCVLCALHQRCIFFPSALTWLCLFSLLFFARAFIIHSRHSASAV